MKLRTRPLVAVVVALLLLGGGVAAAQTVPSLSGAASAQQTNGEGTIQVGAVGTVETDPDRAVVRVTVVAEGDDVAAVRERLATNSSRMRTAVNEVGVRAIRSVDFDIDENFRRRPEDRREEPRFVGRHTFEVVVTPAKAGDVIVAAVENGGARVQGVRYTITEETRQQLRQEALTEAMGNARTDAESIADEAGLIVLGVEQVRTNQIRTDPFQREVAFTGGGDGGAPTTIESGEVTVTTRIMVSYRVTG